MPFFKGFLPQNLGAIDRLQAFAEARGTSCRARPLKTSSPGFAKLTVELISNTV
jgi:hypothetical protein